MADTAEPTTLNRGRPTHESSAPRRQKILDLHADGRTGVSIAKELGITPAAVCYHLKKARAEGLIVDPEPEPESNS